VVVALFLQPARNIGEVVARQFADKAAGHRRIVGGNRVNGHMNRVFPSRQPTVSPPRAKSDGGEDHQQDQDADFAEHVFGRMWVDSL
jgi:hypothetical protein